MAGHYSTQGSFIKMSVFRLYTYIDKWYGMAEDQRLGKSATEAESKVNI